MSRRNCARVVCALAFFLPAFLCAAGAAHDHHQLTDELERQEVILNSHLHLLNEFSERRRVNVFFRNEQSTAYGVPLRFVNSSKGNLTFVRRDLVTIGRIPIVVARVYDSSANSSPDFAPGWRLSVAETLVQRAGTFIYTDDSGSEWSLRRDSKGRYGVQPAVPTDIAHAEQTGNEVRIVHQNGWTKTFSTVGERFVLTEIADPYGNKLQLTYVADRLSRVSDGKGRFVSVERDSSGRVKLVKDDQNRSVAYEYDDAAKLAHVVDLGGNRWSYKYDSSGRLQQAVDARGNALLVANYTPQGRAREVSILGARYRYEYRGRITTVLDHADRMTRIEHTDLGMASAIANAEGLRSELKFDSRNRVKALIHNGRNVASFLYDPSGKLVSIQRPNGMRVADADKTQILTNPAGGLVRIADGNSLREFTAEGDLSLAAQGENVSSYLYHQSGQVESVKTAMGMTELAYHPDGKVKSIKFHDGSVHEYEYSALGFRRNVSRSDGSVKSFEYDSAGNLRRSEGRNADGEVADERIEVDEFHRPRRIEYPSGKRLSIQYDAQGNPDTVQQWFSDAAGQMDTAVEPKTFEYSYDAANRIVAVQVDDAISGTYDYEVDESDLRRQHDHKTMRVEAPTIRQSASIGDLNSIVYTRPTGSLYGVVRYDESLGSFVLPAAGLVAPDAVLLNSLGRRKLPNGDSDSGTPERVAFDLPSNIIFMPPEYDTINCGVGCVFTGIKLRGDGVYGLLTVPVGKVVTLVASKQVAQDCPGGVLWSIFVGPEYVGGGVGASLQRYYQFLVPGTHWAQAMAECNGCDVFGSAQLQVNVTGSPPQCAVTTQQNSSAITGLSQLPFQQPFEWAFSMRCEAGSPNTITHSSFNSSFDTGNDPCRTTVTIYTDQVAAAHTHPWFATPSEYTFGSGCHGDKTSPTAGELNTYNTVTNTEFSNPDKSLVTQTGKPFYMRTPDSQHYKVRKIVSGAQQTQVLQ